MLLATPTSTTVDEPPLDLPRLDMHVLEGEVVESIAETSPLDSYSPRSLEEHHDELQRTLTANLIIQGEAKSEKSQSKEVEFPLKLLCLRQLTWKPQKKPSKQR